MHPGWNATFYPPEMPEDWRLSYYANEFRAVLLPFEALRDSSAQDVRSWGEAARPDFKFALELRPHPAIDELAVKAAPLAGRIVAILIRGAAGRGVSPAFVENCVRSFACVPVTLDLPAQPSLDPALLNRLGAALYWPMSVAVACRGDCAMGRLSPVSDLRALRAQIEDFLGYASDCPRAVLVAEGDSPDIELMSQARLIGEMLGH
jgi:hypothetical protein